MKRKQAVFVDLDMCEGFQFRYFLPDQAGGAREVRRKDVFLAAEERVLQRALHMFKNRQDLLEAIMCMDGGIEVHLYHGHGFVDLEEYSMYFYGRATFDGGQMIMELGTEELLYGGQEGHEVLDVVIHELTHVLDFQDDVDGVLPGWTLEECVHFDRLRDIEIEKIQQGASILGEYGGKDEWEFLGVLVETFFVKPVELRAASPQLYEMMRKYFRQDPVEAG